jgi:peptide/nickel transport system ATP-binding protein
MDQVIEATLRTARCPRRGRGARGRPLRKLGLPDPETFGRRYPHQVSGGQLQRAMTAMALCPSPILSSSTSRRPRST